MKVLTVQVTAWRGVRTEDYLSKHLHLSLSLSLSLCCLGSSLPTPSAAQSNKIYITCLPCHVGILDVKADEGGSRTQPHRQLDARASLGNSLLNASLQSRGEGRMSLGMSELRYV